MLTLSGCHALGSLKYCKRRHMAVNRPATGRRRVMRHCAYFGGVFVAEGPVILSGRVEVERGMDDE